MMNDKQLFTFGEILGMDSKTFSELFQSKIVEILLANDQVVTGLVSEIGISSNYNDDNNKKERLPVSLKVNRHNVFITNIKQIEVW
jgi:hypothetical protein